MKYTLLLLLLTLTACTETTPSWVIKTALVQCASHKGISSISRVGGRRNVICNDGSQIVLKLTEVE